MAPSSSRRFVRLWKLSAVFALLLVLTGSLGLYLYAQRQYTSIRALEDRSHHAAVEELSQYLRTLAREHVGSGASVAAISTAAQENRAQVQDYLAAMFRNFPTLLRVLLLDQQGAVLWGQERAAVTRRLMSAEPPETDARQRALAEQRIESASTIQRPLSSGMVLRGDFAATDSTAAIRQLTTIALQIAVAAIILMFALGIALIASQITEQLSAKQQRLEEYVVSLQQSRDQLLRTRKELQISEKLASLGYLAAGVAHEIGNPLSAALGYIELLRKTSFPADTQHDILGRTQQEIERIGRIVQELVTFSRPQPMTRRIVDVNALIRQVIERLPEFPEKALDIRLHLPQFPLFAEVDPAKLQSVIANIVGNAIDAIAASGQIMISTSRRIHESTAMIGSSEVIAIQCTDTGRGIPDEEQSRIFDPFFTTKSPGKGMGLGLALCHRIIESFHGDITVESAVGEGTTVTIYLPPSPRPKE